MLAAVDRYTGFHGGALVCLGVAAVGAVVLAIVFAFRFIATFPKQPEPGPETSDLGPEPPALVNLLVNRFEIRSAAVPATLVDLAARRMLGLEQVGPEGVVVRVRERSAGAVLTPYERQVLDAVREDATGGSAPLPAIDLGSASDAAAWSKRFEKAVVADARTRGLARNRWSRADWVVLGGLAAFVVLFLAAALSSAHVGSGGDDPMDATDWFVFAGVAWGLGLAGLASLRAIRDTPEGRAAAARWLGVRAHQRTNPSFADAPPGSVAIWGRSLAYGVALGTARATSAALPLGAEDPSLAWSRHGGTWRQVRIEYPTRFGYGQRPVSVLAGGLARLAFWGAVSFVALPVVIGALWRFVGDEAPDLASGWELAIGAVFVLVFGVMGAYLVVRLADAAIRTFRGAADLGAPPVEDGVVLTVGDGEQAGYVAVDDGRAAETLALRLPPDAPALRRGMAVRTTVSRHLRHVTRIEPLSPHAES